MMRTKLFGLLSFLVLGGAAFGGNFWQPLAGPADNAVWGLTANPLSGDVFVSFPSESEPDFPSRGASVFRSSDQGASWTALTNWPVQRRAIALVTKGTNMVFAAAQTDGVYRSTDNGVNWLSATNGLSSAPFVCLALNSAGNVLAGSGGGGVFRSNDDGTNWTAANNGLTQSDVRVIVVDSGQRIFAGTGGGGMFRSTNNAASWSAISTGLTVPVVNVLFIRATDELFAGTTNGLFRSTNHGDIWTSVAGLPNADVRAFGFNSAGDWLLGTAVGSFVSTNAGVSWKGIELTITNLSLGKLTIGTNGNLFAGSLIGLFRSQDQGMSWQKLSQGLAVGVVRELAFDSQGQFFAGTMNSGLHRSRDLGQSWERMALPGVALTAQIFSVGVSPNDTVLAGTYVLSPTSFATHLLRSHDGGDTWQGGNSSTVTAHLVGGFAFGNNGEGFATVAFNANSGVIRSVDNGTNWMATGRTNVATYSVRRNSAGHLFAGTETNGIYRSLNNGTNWMAVGPPAGNMLAIAFNAANHVFAASSKGNPKGVFRSTDNGTNWANVMPNVAACALTVTMTQEIYCGSETGVYCSTNNGANWILINSGLPPLAITSLKTGPDGKLYAGTGGNGIFRSVYPVEPVSTLSIGLSNGIPVLQLCGKPYQSYSLLSSSNLTGWAFIGPIVTAADGTAVWATAVSATNHYYRAVWP